MRVSEAIDSRISCRSFHDTPVPQSTVVAILEAAKRAPSGGNLQPWRVDVLTGAPLAEFPGILRPTQRPPRGFPGHHTHKTALAAGGESHEVSGLPADPAGAVSLAALQVRRRSVRN